MFVVAVSFGSELKHSSAANFAVDLTGTPDTRPNTWGTAGYVVWPVHFDAPSGYRVRILRVYGDLLIWPKGRAVEGAYAGTLLSLHTSPPETPISRYSPLMVDNCFLYIQLATGGRPERAAFDNAVATGGLLAKDNTLYVKVAVWLNDTGLPIHIEPTWVTVFQIEDAAGNALPSSSNSIAAPPFPHRPKRATPNNRSLKRSSTAR